MDNVQALKNLYEQLGGDPADVADISTNADMINAISNLDIGGGGSEPFVVDVSWDSTSSKYVTTKTSEEIEAAIATNPYNIAMEVRFELYPDIRFLNKDIGVSLSGVRGSITEISASNAYIINSFKIGIHGPQGFGVYYEKQIFRIKSDGTTTVEYQQIPEVI